jgi:hypothetical protein
MWCAEVSVLQEEGQRIEPPQATVVGVGREGGLHLCINLNLESLCIPLNRGLHTTWRVLCPRREVDEDRLSSLTATPVTC